MSTWYLTGVYKTAGVAVTSGSGREHVGLGVQSRAVPQSDDSGHAPGGCSSGPYAST